MEESKKLKIFKEAEEIGNLSSSWIGIIFELFW